MDFNTRAPRLLALLLLVPLLACAAGSESSPPDAGKGKGGSGGASAAGAGGDGGSSATGNGGTTGTGGAGSGTGGAGGTTSTTGRGGSGGSVATTGAGGTTVTTTGAGGVTGSGGATGTGNTGGSTPRANLNGKKALIIVDDPASLDDGEIILQQLLQIRGITVAIGGATDAAMAAGQNVIFISSGAAADIVTSFGSAAVPMVVFGNTYFQPLGLSPTGSANKGTIDSKTVMAITDASTSLAGGMTAGTTFTMVLDTRSASLYWGTPGGQAIKVASPMGAATQGAAFAFEKGAMTATGTAAARRVAFAWRTNVFKDLTVAATRLMDAAFDWTVGAPQ